MNIEIRNVSLFSDCADGKKACEILSDELLTRLGTVPEIAANAAEAGFVFVADARECKDSYSITVANEKITVTAKGIRGFIFAIGMILRKSVFEGGKFCLIKDISGDYVPDKKIRGHQIGYRKTPNTYDAWTYEDYYRYYLDMMFFGTNTVEHIPYEGLESNRNVLMRYDEQKLIAKAAAMADEIDLDVSLWYPNCDGETCEQAVERRSKFFKTVPRIDVVFPPGGDPGELYPDEFIKRCREISKALKQVHPNAQMWPSAQKPHSIPTWGEEFIEEMEKLPEEIDGVITGPNRAFPIDELRRRLPEKYPIRLYPDITHNVRCEYPVHFNRDDWHYALTAGLSRECTNPRPTEYRLIHRLTRRYVVGSVSYSEGVNDDVNKMVWSDMDFFPEADTLTTLCDYSRLFFPGVPARRVADAILALELNWACDPAENPGIDGTLKMFTTLSEEYPSLNENWRFIQLLFRAKCDWILRFRRLFELELIDRAQKPLRDGNLVLGREILSEEFPEVYSKQLASLEGLAKKLFIKIGMQLDVARYCTNGWERGAVLDSIKMPVTDRAWLLNRLDYADTLPENEKAPFILRVLDRNRVRADEYYFSVAEHGLDVLGVDQTGEIYMDFQGDRPNVNTGAMPTCMFKVYDNLTFRCKVGGFLPDTDYKLIVTFTSKKIPVLNHHKVTVNGKVIYEGNQYGGEKNEEFDRELCAPGFETATYLLKSDVFVNGCADIELSEPHMGIIMSELRIIRA